MNFWEKAKICISSYQHLTAQEHLPPIPGKEVPREADTVA